MRFVIIGLIVLVVLSLVLFIGLAAYSTFPRTNLEASKNWEYSHGFFRDFDKRETVKYTLTAEDGHVIHVEYVPNPDFPDSRKVMVISHGYTSSRYGGLKYLNLWMRLGYSCVLFDQRFHGANSRKLKYNCTLGVKESRDLMLIIEDTYKRLGDDIYMGLQGESMGSATQITALKYHPRVHFLVNDCGFAYMVDVLKGELKNLFHLPTWLVYPASFFSRILFGWSYLKNRPIDSLKDNEIPICFVHGDKDMLINMSHSLDMQKATKGYSEVNIFEGAAHADSLYSNEERYFEMLEKFLKKVEELEAEKPSEKNF